jgi:hypothetical protein
MPYLGAPIAQLDRAADYGSAGYRFNSYWVRHSPAPVDYSLRRLLALLLMAALALSIVPDASAGAAHAKKAYSAKSSKSAKKAAAAKPNKFLFFD